jgi:hypothetical protein
MDTHKAIAELARWAGAASEGDAGAAEQHLQRFYHIGSALVASKDFQASWRARRSARLEPSQLEDVCTLLSAIAEVEASQVVLHGRAAA